MYFSVAALPNDTTILGSYIQRRPRSYIASLNPVQRVRLRVDSRLSWFLVPVPAGQTRRRVCIGIDMRGY